ncbi:MAG: Mov34/MPN/PAD-1 family protein [Nitrospinae bacterium]|nr:Mov34/MPN/PAD-1 family protein [Nitrospinota bacterium]
MKNKKIKELIQHHQLAMEKESTACYPSEACGFIIASETESEFIPCENLQDKMHAYDPETFPRDSKTAYYISPKKFMDSMKQGEKTGKKISVIFHSHPDHEAYFSEEDQKAAQLDGEPVYPDIVHHVISIKQGVPDTSKTFCWNNSLKEFNEMS